MIRLLQLLLFGHVHKWKVIEQSPYTITADGRVVSKGTMRVLQCEHCGALKTFKDMG